MRQDKPTTAQFLTRRSTVLGLAGAVLARRLADKRGALNVAFAAVIFVVAAYMLVRSVGSA